jgi:hypothetical protein
VQRLVLWKDSEDKYLPKPSFILGEVDSPRDAEDLCADPERKAVLRELDEYRSLMFHFTPALLKEKKFEACLKERHSSVLSPTLEAFFVITYCNNYDKWASECGGTTTANQAHPGGDASTTATGSSTLSGESQTKFTNTAKSDGGRFKGWSQEAYDLFNKITRVLRIQRSCQHEVLLKVFDDELMMEFRNKKTGTSNAVNDGRSETLRGSKRAFYIEDDFEWKKAKETLEDSYKFAAI